MSNYVNQMFSSIAFSYDLLNRLLSFGLDKTWRKRAAMEMNLSKKRWVLDLATGTGDMAMEIASLDREEVRIIGGDFNLKMLWLAKEKSSKLKAQNSKLKGQSLKLKAQNSKLKVEFNNCMAEKLPFKDNSFDYLSIAFGIRNFSSIAIGLKEMKRVLKKKGKVIILELSVPKGRLRSKVYLFYLSHFIPFLGGVFSEKEAYRYLANSIKEFPSPEAILSIMEEVGFKNVRYKDLTYGITTIYVGEKG